MAALVSFFSNTCGRSKKKTSVLAGRSNAAFTVFLLVCVFWKSVEFIGTDQTKAAPVESRIVNKDLDKSRK